MQPLLTLAATALAAFVCRAQTPNWTLVRPIPTTLHHAFVVYDGRTNPLFTASNPVSVRLR